ncbi:MAG: family 16 glycosylhydrolase [Anaerolineaceae bacterium]|nr:family 16 glycosylhydrolase [Anaerolineaceae bacterium]
MPDKLTLQHPLTLPWRITQYGLGQVIPQSDALHLTLPTTDASRYHDAQLTDYAGKTDFHWRPPLRMEVTASMAVTSKNSGLNSPSLLAERGIGGEVLKSNLTVGTAGFGFWNHPFVPGERGLRLPKAVWFFFSAPPSNMHLAQDVSGPGWKAATIDATRWQFLALAPAAPIGVLLMRMPALYRRLWPIGQRAIGVSEHQLDSSLLLETHTYSIDWQPDHIRFAVDGITVHDAAVRIAGLLGFIAWVDNQYAIVTPQGNIGFGLVDIPQPQTLILNRIEIESLNSLSSNS